MNKRQKLVLERFLDNEEVVLKRLRQVYNQSLKDVQQKAQSLQDEINRLGSMVVAEEDANEKARLVSMQQAKVYQKQYQDALKKQISSILDNMQVEGFKTISDYLQTCYEDGFVGAMFDLHGQGIPLILPIDQEAVVRAVQLDSKISQGLYTRLGEDVAALKKKITAQVSRGIATGMSYQQMAQQLEAYTKIGYNNAARITRTEGHRIQVQAGMDACYKAKDKGADVVKQWDATLDGKTRKSHRKVDGEIRKLDEKFSNGLRYPGDPAGEAAEVVHCRCALLQRARWALDEDELQTLRDRADFFELGKEGDFDDFRKKYLKASDVFTQGKQGVIKASSIQDAEQFAKQVLGMKHTTAYSSGLNIDVANGLNEAILKIGNTFGSLPNSGYLEDVLFFADEDDRYAGYNIKNHSVYFNTALKNSGVLKKMAKDALEEFEPGAWSTGDALHSVYHELGHAVQHMILDDDASRSHKIDVLFQQTFIDILGIGTEWTKDNRVALGLAMKAKKAGFSYYGMSDPCEFVAESIAQYFLAENPCEISKKVIEILMG